MNYLTIPGYDKRNYNNFLIKKFFDKDLDSACELLKAITARYFRIRYIDFELQEAKIETGRPDNRNCISTARKICCFIIKNNTDKSVTLNHIYSMVYGDKRVSQHSAVWHSIFYVNKYLESRYIQISINHIENKFGEVILENNLLYK